jgi:hypothetical protein
VDDINGLLRSYALDASPRDPLAGEERRGARTWGEFAARLERDLTDMYAAGAASVVVALDGPAPVAKHATQDGRAQKRKKSDEKKRAEYDVDDMLADLEDKPAPPPPAHEWPHVPDVTDPAFLREEWFADDTRVVVSSLDQVYYDRAAKIKFTQYLSEYLLHRFPLPACRRLVLDCGWTYAHGRLPAPVHVRWAVAGRERWGNLEPVVHSDALLHPFDELKSKGTTRVIEPVPGMERYGPTAEADDRLVRWVYACQDQADVVVCSIDQVRVTTGFLPL